MITRGEFVAFVLGGLVQRAWPWLLERLVLWRTERSFRKAVTRCEACPHAHVGIDYFPEDGREGAAQEPLIKCADCWALWVEPVDVTATGVVQLPGYWTPNFAKPTKRFMMAHAVGLGEEAAEEMQRRARGERKP